MKPESITLMFFFIILALAPFFFFFVSELALKNNFPELMFFYQRPASDSSRTCCCVSWPPRKLDLFHRDAGVQSHATAAVETTKKEELAPWHAAPSPVLPSDDRGQ